MIGKLWGYGKLLTWCVVFVFPAGIACLWVLAFRYTGLLSPGDGWMWIASNLVAPWVLLGAGLILLAGGLIRFFWHRVRARREEKALGVRLPLPSLVLAYLGAAGVSLVVSGLVLAPKHLPAGVLIAQSEEVNRLPTGYARWKGEQFIMDYSDQRYLHCKYLTPLGVENNDGPASFGSPYCRYFLWRH